MNRVIKRLRGKESGIRGRAKTANLLEMLADQLGQQYPKHYPQAPEGSGGELGPSSGLSPLGPPLDIKQVARLIGCSPWTVRHTLLKKGLPAFRLSGASSKLIFYTDQVVRWIERQQLKGG